jgi:exonuclease SbcC
VLKRIRLESFMSHLASEIELAPGLTVLTGPNNCGKSAVVAAIEAVARNTVGAHAIRHGAREARVTLETGDGHTVTWVRGKAGAHYVVDGESITRLGKSAAPERVEAILRLPVVRPGEEGEGGGREEIDVHLGAQKEPIFLLDRSAGEAARFFAATGDAARLLEMQRRHRDRVQERRRERAALEARIGALDAEVALLERAAPLEAEVARAREEAAAIERGERTSRALAPAIARIRAAREALLRAGERREALRPLAPPPPLEDTAPLARAIAHRARLEGDLARARPRAAALAPLAAPPPLAPTAPLRALLARIFMLEKGIGRSGAALARLAPLGEPPRVEETAPLRAARERLRSLEGRLEAARRRARALEALPPPPPPPLETAPLAQAIARLASLEREDRRRRAALDGAARDLAASEDALREYVRAHPTCALCGAPLDPDRLLGHAHAGGGAP